MSVSAQTAQAMTAAGPPSVEAYLSFALYALISTGLILLLMLLARFLGNRTHSPDKDAPYESAIIPTGEAKLRQAVPFSLVAIFFIIFDIEAIFVVSWAIAYDLLGWTGFWQITFFIVLLFLGLVYLWKVGALEWGARNKSSQHRRVG